MFSAAFDIVHNNEDAEDAVHNAFVGIARNIRAIDKPVSARTLSYVIKAAKNSAINIANSKKKASTVEYTDNLYLSDNDFFSQLCVKEDYSKVVQAISELRDIYKLPMYYYFICDMKIKEIADLTELSTSAVKTRIHRGKKELLKILGEDQDDK